MDEIVSDGSPLPPPISSTFWPTPIRASSTRPAVNGANICAMSTRYLSQYRAEACHASKALFCSFGFILARRKLTSFSHFVTLHFDCRPCNQVRKQKRKNPRD